MVLSSKVELLIQ